MTASSMNNMSATDLAALRAARAAPAFRLYFAANSGDVSGLRLQERLNGTRRGSRCADICATAALSTVPQHRSAALAHPACPPAVRRAAVDDSYHTTGDAAWGVPGWVSRSEFRPAPSRAHMVRFVEDDSVADTISSELYAEIAQRSGCPPALLRRAAVRFASDSPNCPPDTFARMTFMEDTYVRCRAASHRSCPPRVLRYFAADRSESVRNAAAANPSTGPEALKILADDPISDIRLTTARHRRCPPKALAELASDSVPAVSEAALSNAACPAATLERATRHTNGPFRVAAANPSCPPAALGQLAASVEVVHRQAAAAGVACPPRTLTVLAGDPHSGVRAAVAENPRVRAAVVGCSRRRHQREGAPKRG